MRDDLDKITANLDRVEVGLKEAIAGLEEAILKGTAHLVRARAQTAEWGAYDPSWDGQWHHPSQRWIGGSGRVYDPNTGIETFGNDPPPVYFVSSDNRVREIGLTEYTQYKNLNLPDLVETSVLACARLHDAARVQEGFLQPQV
jgi:hypothetical protein